jgi:hypothetical protein
LGVALADGPSSKEREMIRTHRSSTTAVLIVCLLGTTSSGILFASDDEPSSRTGSASLSADTSTTAKEDVSTISATSVSAGERLAGTTEFVRSLSARSPFMLGDTLTARSLAFSPAESSVFAQRGGRGRGYGGRRNNGAAAAMFVGAAAAIAGTAVLVYANRPECSTLPSASGCGYGTKVVGGAVLSAGVVGLLVGALTWR